MFDLERQLGGTQRMVATEAQELSAAQQQKDIFDAHRHRVFSVSYYMTANEMEAENILTSTFQNAFAATRKPSAQTVDQALLLELEQRFSLAPSEPAKPDADGQFSRTGVRRTDLEEAVATLPPRERLLFLLRDVEGYAPDRIAGLLGCAEAEVHKGLFSARIRMRNALAKQRTVPSPIPEPAAARS